MRFRRKLPFLFVLLVHSAMSGVGTASAFDSMHRQAAPASEETFTAFESGQVRPLALSADGKYLFAVNTPDGSLEIFHAHGDHLMPVTTVRVGLEPVAVAVAPNGDVWVVNHLSDSVSIVDMSNPQHPFVKRTLLVGDEPRDIVFGGTEVKRAFITTAHRGQNTGRDPQLTTPGVGRADVWVFDAQDQGNTLEGTPVNVVTLFSDTPRALAVSADGATVYAAAFHSGNQTTTVTERLVTNFGGLPLPTTDANGAPAPWTGLIVKYRADENGEMHWLDNEGRVWDDQVQFTLPDKDVFAIDATAATPALKDDGEFSSVGTVLFNMAVNPANGKVYVANLESLNHIRFEGHNASGDGSSVRGHFAESRITVISDGDVAPRHLNKHLDYSVDGTPAQAAKSLAFPMGMEVSADGEKLYVAAMGSNKLAIMDTAKLENDTFVPSASNHVLLTGGGPTGLALKESNGLAYVMTRYDNGISIVDTHSKQEIGHVTMYNPEPASIVEGRRFLYDASYSSSHGDSACAGCHIFGDFDSLAWDLGDPDGIVQPNMNPQSIPGITLPMTQLDFHPLKGPMTTQSLRGMANHGPMHWRGDRTGAFTEENVQPDSGAYNEEEAFRQFNGAFVGLMGRSAPLTPDEMQKFADFMLQVMYPPNPIRNLDNSLTAQQEAGRAFYFNQAPDGTPLPVDTFHNCNGCHTLDPTNNAEYGVAKPGLFGTNATVSFGNPQFVKVAQLRNMYQKVGMFGNGNTLGLPMDIFPPLTTPVPFPLNDNSFQGDQVRGFGFIHDGSVDTLFRFFGNSGFVQNMDPPFPNPFGIPADATGMEIRRNLEAFVLAFPTNLAPIVGQQTTLTKTNASAVNPRISLLEERTAAGESDLVVSGNFLGLEVNFLYDATSGNYVVKLADKEISLSMSKLRALANKTPLTFTAVPVNTGEHMAFARRKATLETITSLVSE